MDIQEAIKILKSRFKECNITKAEYFEDLDEIEEFSRYWKFTSVGNNAESDTYAVNYFTLNCHSHEIEIDCDFFYQDGSSYDPAFSL